MFCFEIFFNLKFFTSKKFVANQYKKKVSETVFWTVPIGHFQIEKGEKINRFDTLKHINIFIYKILLCLNPIS